MKTHDWWRFRRYMKPDPETGCINWTGAHSGPPTNRRAMFWYDRRNHCASRVIWTAYHGMIPEGMCVCHTCDNPSCVNVEHLWLGTLADNNHDKAVKGRAPGMSGSDNPLSVLTEETVLRIREEYATGKTTCKALGAQYGVAKATISLICSGKTWPHVGGPTVHRKVGTYPKRGRRNPNARLTEAQVAAMRAKYTGEHGQIAVLAKEFGVCWSSAKNVVAGRTW
jgi:hypothetical protein